jgi:3-oxoacyl-[acyl-carrier-protein] synthase II
MSGPVISAWSAVSPYGIGSTPFADGVARGPAVPVPVDPAAGPVPAPLAYQVPAFDAQSVLGRKGTRTMDRVSALSVTAVRELVASADPDRAVTTGPSVGLVLGTTTGSAQSMMDITRDTLVQEKPFYVDTARIPNAVMNSAAAQCAIWYHLEGPNATIAGGRVAGLSALRYARRLLDSGRAGTVFCGGVEEYSPARAWLEYHGRRPGEPAAILGEGAALLLIEPASRAGGRALAEVLAVEGGVYLESDPTRALVACLHRALDRAGVTIDEVWAVAATPAPGPLGDAELAAIDQLFGDRPVRSVPGGQPWGDAGAATAPFQIAATLAMADRNPQAAGRVAVVTAVDRDGLLGCALLRTAGTGKG